MVRKTLMILGSAAIVALLAPALWMLTFGPPKPTWRDDEIVEIRVREAVFAEQAPGKTSRITDRGHVRKVLATLKPRTLGPAHLCENRAYMELDRGAGGIVTLALLPGHDNAYYEVGVAGWRAERVDRKTFLAALRNAGVDWLPEDCSK